MENKIQSYNGQIEGLKQKLYGSEVDLQPNKHDITQNTQNEISSEELSLLKTWIPFHFSKIVLLYKASIDGFSAKDFHSKVDGYENTLTIITSENGRRFGGFTPLKFESTDEFKTDNSLVSFIFSFYWKTKFSLKPGGKDCAIYDGKEYYSWNSV